MHVVGKQLEVLADDGEYLLAEDVDEAEGAKTSVEGHAQGEPPVSADLVAHLEVLGPTLDSPETPVIAGAFNIGREVYGGDIGHLGAEPDTMMMTWLSKMHDEHRCEVQTGTRVQPTPWDVHELLGGQLTVPYRLIRYNFSWNIHLSLVRDRVEV